MWPDAQQSRENDASSFFLLPPSFAFFALFTLRKIGGEQPRFSCIEIPPKETGLNILDTLCWWKKKQVTSILSNASGKRGKHHIFSFMLSFAQRHIPSIASTVSSPLIILYKGFHLGIVAGFLVILQLWALVSIKTDHLLSHTSKPQSALSYKWFRLELRHNPIRDSLSELGKPFQALWSREHGWVQWLQLSKP